MVWVKAQNGNLYECSAFEIDKVTPSQIQIVNQNKKILGEYMSIDRTELVLKRIKDYIMGNKTLIFEMPPRFEEDTL